MTITYEDLNPSFVENTTMQKVFRDGVHRTYYITPLEGYFLHDKTMDDEELDPETMMPTGNILLGYRTATASCAANYDFVANPREFYTSLAEKMQ